MSTWNIYTRGSGTLWLADGTIPVPNEDMTTSTASTTQKIKLADGSYGYISPEIKTSKDSISMVFKDTTSAFRVQIQEYIDNDTEIRIVAHTAEEFIGKVINIQRVWFVGRTDSYDVQVTLEQTA